MNGKQAVMNVVLKTLNDSQRQVNSLEDWTQEDKDEATQTIFRMKGYLKWLAKQD